MVESRTLRGTWLSRVNFAVQSTDPVALFPPARTGILFATRRIKGPAQRVASTRLCKRSDIFAKRTAACSITDEEGLWRNSVYPTCSIFLSLLAGEFPPSFFSFFPPQTFGRHWSRHWPSAWQRRNFAAVSLAIVTRDECWNSVPKPMVSLLEPVLD